MRPPFREAFVEQTLRGRLAWLLDGIDAMGAAVERIRWQWPT